MSISIPRRPTRQVRVGQVLVGSDAPVVVQSMTNTDTADVAATVRQTQQLAEAGSELVRLTVNNAESAAAVPRIREALDAFGENPSVRDVLAGSLCETGRLRGQPLTGGGVQQRARRHRLERGHALRA